MSIYDVSDPEQESISVSIQNVLAQFNGVPPLTLKRFLSYELDDDFLVPSGQWRFTISGDSLSDTDRKALVPGATTEISIDDRPQFVGYLDDVKTTSGRGGTIVTIEGRGWLSPAIDAHVDQSYRLNEGATLLQLLNDVFKPFHMTVVSDDNIANNNAQTGATRGHKTSKKGKTSRNALLHETKPYPQEGAFAFASRVSQRFGLWLWPSSTLGTLICAQPDYGQDASYQILHSTAAGLSDHNNVKESAVTFSTKDQPTIIFASGFGGGGNFSKSRLRGGIINPLIYNPGLSGGSPLYQPVTDAYPDVQFATFGSADSNGIVTPYSFPVIENFIPIPDPCNRPLYLYDPESHTQAQLEAFLRRTMSLHVRKAFTAEYTIMGHTLNGKPIAVDTIVSVKDDRSAIELPLWVAGRKFVKAPGDGTKTILHCTILGALSF